MLGVNVRVLVGEVLQCLLVVSQHACDQNSGYDWSYQRVHRSVFSSAAWRPFEVNAHNVLVSFENEIKRKCTQRLHTTLNSRL